VRTGPGAQSAPYRCRDGRMPAPAYTAAGVREETRALLTRMKGPEGERVRENVRRLADIVRRAWDKDGAAREEMQGFLRTIDL
jgi:hypothetical protein